mgnify:CR=1 FL=1
MFNLTSRLESIESTVVVIIAVLNAKPDNFFQARIFLCSSNVLLSYVLYMGVKNFQQRTGASREIQVIGTGRLMLRKKFN